MLQVSHLTKYYGANLVLNDITFLVNHGERVGLIGANGAGKSTLLRCITGAAAADSGTVVRSSPALTLGYLPQALTVDQGQQVGDLLDAAQHPLVAAERDVQAATLALASDSDAAAAYDDALARFEALGGYARLGRAAAVLDGLGLAGISHDTPLSRLSGGQKTRLGLATLLLGEPDLLLLDEPTNHLDLDALTWLEAFVLDYRGGVLVVSHDREFLDRTVERILFLDGETRTVTSYAGNYSAFAAARAHEAALHREAWTRQQEYVGRVGADIARLKGEAVAIERGTTPRQPGVRKLAKKKARLAKSREKKLDRYLASEERVEKPRLGWGLKLEFGPPPASGRAVLRLEEVNVAYPGHQPLLQGVNLEVWHGERIAVVGPNGGGKTTLLRLIAGALEPRAGRVRLGAGVRLGLLTQEGETLDGERTVLETVLRERPMSETEARGFLHYFLFAGESVFRRVDACSYGERTRLQLALLVLRGCNLLLLDEPLNHLDIEGREHFEAALAAYEGTVVAVSHDRAFLRSFAERTVEVRDGRVVSRDA